MPQCVDLSASDRQTLDKLDHEFNDHSARPTSAEISLKAKLTSEALA